MSIFPIKLMHFLSLLTLIWHISVHAITLENVIKLNRTTALGQKLALVTGERELKCILLVPNLHPRIFVVKTQNLFS